MKHPDLRDRFALVWMLALFGLGSCVDLNDPHDTSSTAIHESELASGWTSPFQSLGSSPRYPVTCGSSAHVGGAFYAADIAAPAGTPVYAAHGGVIEIAGWTTNGYGYLVKLRPADLTGHRHYYGHLKEIEPSVKGNITAHVGQGQLIGWVGSTGSVAKTLLHFHVETDQGAAVTLVGMEWFADDPDDPYYASNDGYFHDGCASLSAGCNSPTCCQPSDPGACP